ncbi:MAG: hypothetical protein ACTHKM_08535 [Tsuneonella sp.]
MVRRKQLAQANAAKMYRHFAVVTIAATAMMAMMVDGESRDALARDMQQRQQSLHHDATSAPKYGRARLTSRVDAASRGSFGPDNGEFGAAMDDAGGASDSGAIPGDWGVRPSLVPNAWSRYGLTEAEWNALSPAEREQLAQAYRAREQSFDPGERARQVASLQASSAARSGEATAAD